MLPAEHWTDSPLLTFHLSKSSHLRIGYTLGPDHTIQNSTDKVKDIGVIFDSSLNSEVHVSETINTNSMMDIKLRTFDHMNEHCFTTIVRSLVHSHIEYASQVWIPSLLKHVTALQNVQRRATTSIPGFRDIDYKELLHELKLPTLAYRRLRGNMIELYKILRGKYDASVSSSLVMLRDNDSDKKT